ncbi:hypothetical protein ACIQ6Y_12500 [Streptomyces sp. NPDC096205]|uniref:hypothetical protein n=1 Tax=Streptomyces sp. NPDC096205 TaxID=3366081 RepID=UPI0038266CC2
MSITIQIQEVPSRVSKLLPLPPLDGLSVGQVRGAMCIWCDTPLTAETAVDLGERRHRRLDGHYSTFPRACCQCTSRAAFTALHIHAPDCDTCRHNPAGCEAGAILLRMIRDGRR